MQRASNTYDTRRPHAQINVPYPLSPNSNKNKPLPSPGVDSPLSAYSLSPQELSLSSSSTNKSRFSISPTSPRSVMPPKLRIHGRKPSLQNTMSWLTRTTSSNSQSSTTVPYAKASKPMRISEPKLVETDNVQLAGRLGPLGSGAQVVRTPHEALTGSSVSVQPHTEVEGEHEFSRLAFDKPVPEVNEMEEGAIAEGDSPGFREELEESGSEYDDDEDERLHEMEQRQQAQRNSGGSSSGGSHRVPPAYSPPRSSLSLSKSTPCLITKPVMAPSRPCPPLPLDAKIAPLKLKHTSPPPFVSAPPTPAIPSHLTSPTLQPSFEFIQLSDVSYDSIHGPLDPARVIVTIETTSASHCTTLATLTSRPSHLGAHLLALLTPPAHEPGTPRDREREEEDDMSVRSHVRYDEDDYSDVEGGFPSIFKQHLAASGLLLPSPVASTHPMPVTRMHIFLDRPSDPYEHILAHLRSPPPTLDHPRSLPIALRILPNTDASTATLVAVRDEAHYLGLSDLVSLCISELRARYSPPAPRPAHSRGPSATLPQHAVPARTRDSVGSSRSGSTSVSGGRPGSSQVNVLPMGHRKVASRDGVVIPPEEGRVSNDLTRSLRTKRPAANWV